MGKHPLAVAPEPIEKGVSEPNLERAFSPLTRPLSSEGKTLERISTTESNGESKETKEPSNSTTGKTVEIMYVKPRNNPPVRRGSVVLCGAGGGLMKGNSTLAPSSADDKDQEEKGDSERERGEEKESEKDRDLNEEKDKDSSSGSDADDEGR